MSPVYGNFSRTWDATRGSARLRCRRSGARATTGLRSRSCRRESRFRLSVTHACLSGIVAVARTMTDDTIPFRDGAAYERYMGVWSRLAGDQFLDWLAPSAGLAWLDVGAGNGAFTEMLVERCTPASVVGIDPSEEQLAFARARPALSAVSFVRGDAQALPFADDGFDAAVMPLVIFFVPDPKKGVAEMARVVRSGGIVTAYAWDMY